MQKVITALSALVIFACGVNCGMSLERYRMIREVTKPLFEFRWR